MVRKQADLILTKLPAWDPKDGKFDFYFWYHASNALRQVGGRHWSKWSKALSKALVPAQRQDGNFLGSWDPTSPWGEDGGRVYSTALALLSLQAEYRYEDLSKVSPIPNFPVFRPLRDHWRDQKYARFASALGRIDVESLTAKEKSALKRIRRMLNDEIQIAESRIGMLKKTGVPGEYALSELLPGPGDLTVGMSKIPVTLERGETTFVEVVREADGFRAR